MAPTPALRLLASDLDGTLIPPDESEARLGEIDSFRRVVKEMRLGLAYVTGRHLSLALDGIARFDLPLPRALACDVGTTLFWHRDGTYAPDVEYREMLAASREVIAADRIRSAVADLPGLRAQEAEKQGEFKASFYVDPGSGSSVVAQVRARLAEVGPVRLVESHDPVTGDGLLDVLPADVGKAGAVRYVAERMGAVDDATVYAGDSGNDRDAILCGIPAVLVGNAPDSLRAELRAEVGRRGLQDRVYFASDRFAAGVVQGLRHFADAS